MPRSKHRRKPGGKSVKNPGRERRERLYETPERIAYQRFHASYAAPFHRRFRGNEDAGFLLDIIAAAAFDERTGMLSSVSKQAVFEEFMKPDDELWGPDALPPSTAEAAETGLAFLIEQGMVEVADDQITVPAHFGVATELPGSAM